MAIQVKVRFGIFNCLIIHVIIIAIPVKADDKRIANLVHNRNDRSVFRGYAYDVTLCGVACFRECGCEQCHSRDKNKQKA